VPRRPRGTGKDSITVEFVRYPPLEHDEAPAPTVYRLPPIAYSPLHGESAKFARSIDCSVWASNETKAPRKPFDRFTICLATVEQGNLTYTARQEAFIQRKMVAAVNEI
jgi:hypothetical protein